jgi:hypothetical protein
MATMAAHLPVGRTTSCRTRSGSRPTWSVTIHPKVTVDSSARPGPLLPGLELTRFS